MRITLESTTKLIDLDHPGFGSPRCQARIWEGHTEGGIPVHCYIVRVAVASDADQEEFRRELQECREPSPAVAALPCRVIL